jgi:hypothetical protein
LLTPQLKYAVLTGAVGENWRVTVVGGGTKNTPAVMLLVMVIGHVLVMAWEVQAE